PTLSSITPPPLPSTLFPYTTLFRSYRPLHGGNGKRSNKGARGRPRVRAGRNSPGRHDAEHGRLRNRRTHAGQPEVKADSDRVFKDRKSTRLNSSHLGISYAVFCLKK